MGGDEGANLDDAALLALGAAALRIDPGLAYAFRSPWKRALGAGLDAFTGRFQSLQSELDREKLESVVALRLDHLGDMVMSLPALEALRRAAPQARLTLVVGPWNQELARLWGRADRVEVWEAPWFCRPQRQTSLGHLRSLAALLQGHDLGVELRGDLRSILALRMAGVPQRLGISRTGGRSLLTHPQPFVPGMHEADQASHALGGLPVRAAGRIPRLRISRDDEAQARAAWRSLGLRGKVVAFQVTSGARSKAWPLQRWARVIDGLPRGMSAVVLGSPQEYELTQELAALCRRPPALAARQLPVGPLAAFLARCAALVSLDTGPAHLAAALGIPTVALFGPTLASRYAPRGPRARYLEAMPPCKPCSLERCPFGNACMQRIRPQQVLRALKEAL
jgi:ADP-heptose:LPS heptosyltransferase